MSDRRPSARQRGYTRRWEKARATYLRSHPTCAICAEIGVIKGATVVDHVIPHNGDQTLFWDQNNWQALCKPHHDGRKQQVERIGYSTDVGADGLPIDPNHPFNTGRGGVNL